MKYKNIVIVGGPGSGKSTQAKLLKEKTEFLLFSPGKRYREIAEQDTHLGNKIKKIIDAGHLCPHWFSAYLFQDVFLGLTESESTISEGIARTKQEAQVFDEVMKWLRRDYIVINLLISKKESITRLNKRRETEEREDDDVEDIPIRIEEYTKYTLPAILFFESLGKIVSVNGEQEPNKVQDEILEKLL